MKYILLTLFTVLSLIWGSVRIFNAISFNKNCGGYLTRAANANTVELASKELTKAIKYLDNNELTTGYTSVIYTTPDEDIGYWYSNLEASLKELKSVNENASLLEKSNVLMKLRESLTSNGEGGDRLIVPKGISMYPYNGIMLFFGLFSVMGTVVTGSYIAATES
jgi:hypothetical protein